MTVPFKYPKLRNTAIPRKFPGFPSYLSKKETKRDDLNEKKDPLEVKQINEAIKLSLRVKVEEDERFSISNYSDFKNCLFKECIPPVWNVIQKDSCTLFLNITLEVAPCIKCSVVVHENLNVNAFIGTSPVTSYINDDKFPFKINDFRDVLKVLKFTECMTEGKDINFDE